MLLMLLNSICALAQIELNDSIFQQKVINEVWFVDDRSQKHQLLIFMVEADSVTMMDLDWLNGFGENTCAYQLHTQRNFFELLLTSCSSVSEANYIYGFLPNDETMAIIAEPAKRSMQNALLKEEGWVYFTLYQDD